MVTTLCFLGCGNMGLAILNSLLQNSRPVQTPKPDGLTEANGHPGDLLPQKFIACVRSSQSAQRLQNNLAQYETSLTVLHGRNAEAVRQADVVLLACKPYMVDNLLNEPGICEGLHGKLLISVVAGWTTEALKALVYRSEGSLEEIKNSCSIVRAMPNTAAMVSESVTVIEDTQPALSPRYHAMVDAIFQQVGQVVHLPTHLMDVSTALCGSTPAFFAIFCEALIDGAVAMGVPRESAKIMAYQALKGTAGLLQSGEHPAILKEKVTSPGGCTIGAIMVLEEAGVRGTISRALRESTSIAGLLGKGLSNVNGTRHT